MQGVLPLKSRNRGNSCCNPTNSRPGQTNQGKSIGSVPGAVGAAPEPVFPDLCIYTPAQPQPLMLCGSCYRQSKERVRKPPGAKGNPVYPRGRPPTSRLFLFFSNFEAAAILFRAGGSCCNAQTKLKISTFFFFFWWLTHFFVGI